MYTYHEGIASLKLIVLIIKGSVFKLLNWMHIFLKSRDNSGSEWKQFKLATLTLHNNEISIWSSWIQ